MISSETVFQLVKNDSISYKLPNQLKGFKKNALFVSLTHGKTKELFMNGLGVVTTISLLVVVESFVPRDHSPAKINTDYPGEIKRNLRKPVISRAH